MKRGNEAAIDQAEWDRVKTRLKQEFGDSAFKSWMSPIVATALRDGEVELSVPTRFMRDWITTHYAERIRALWNGENPVVRKITLKVDAGKLDASKAEASRTEASRAESSRPTAAFGAATGPASAAVTSTRSQGNFARAAARPQADAGAQPLGPDLSAPLDARYSFDNFVVGKPNEFAYAAAKRVAESDQVSFNPLFLYGGVGLGKTHLMHAIAWEIRQRTPHRRVIYLSAEKFMYSFVRALRNQDTVSFKEQFRSVDVLMIDDVQFIAGKDATQEEFFHTFNALVDQRQADRAFPPTSLLPTSRGNGASGSAHAWARGMVADLHRHHLRAACLASWRRRWPSSSA